MRKLLVILAIILLADSSYGQMSQGPLPLIRGYKTHQMRDGSLLTFERTAVRRVGSTTPKSWDAQKVYRVPVILFSFPDCDFSWDDPRQFYHSLFNERGFNLGRGPGCVADYFRDQSQGLFNVQFDIIGPVKLSSKQKSDDKNNYGRAQIVAAIQTADAEVDFSQYDWLGNGHVPTVLFIYAGFGGNETAEECKGCIHPNTGSLGRRTDDGVTISYYSASAELWSNQASCGIGTICHEYCHTFGLPDLYPTDSEEYSVLDEWDLMDGGCFADDGWCPPNLSIHERELMNWQTPVNLTSTTVITDMPSYDESGLAYRLVNDAYPSEYYLLENRQQVGWDTMIPGHGLLISHVDYSETLWDYNIVNNTPNHHRFDYFHADGLDFNFYGRKNMYEDGRSIRLRHTAYPNADTLGVVHDALTDTSSPAATLYHARSDGSKFMGKPITQIQETDGLISFHFSDTPDAITTPVADDGPVVIYDLQGNIVRPALNPSTLRICILRYPDGTTKKVLR